MVREFGQRSTHTEEKSRRSTERRYIPQHPLLAGGITGGIEICITYPLEYAKCQLQLEQLGRSVHAGKSAKDLPAHRPERGLLGVFKDTVRTRGFTGLYSGLSPWLLFSFPRAAFRFSVYEQVLALHDSRFAGQVRTRTITPTHTHLAYLSPTYVLLMDSSTESFYCLADCLNLSMTQLSRFWSCLQLIPAGRRQIRARTSGYVCRRDSGSSGSYDMHDAHALYSDQNAARCNEHPATLPRHYPCSSVHNS